MMPAPSESTLLLCFLVVQIVGLVSLMCARVKGHSLLHRAGRSLFLVSLVAVGLATMCAVGCASDWWVSCGTTLSVMVVGGTFDLGRAAGAAAF